MDLLISLIHYDPDSFPNRLKIQQRPWTYLNDSSLNEQLNEQLSVFFSMYSATSLYKAHTSLTRESTNNSHFYNTA